MTLINFIKQLQIIADDGHDTDDVEFYLKGLNTGALQSVDSIKPDGNGSVEITISR